MVDQSPQQASQQFYITILVIIIIFVLALIFGLNGSNVKITRNEHSTEIELNPAKKPDQESGGNNLNKKSD